MEDKIKLAIAEATQVQINYAATAIKLQGAVDDVHEAMEAVVSAGLAKSHPLVKEAAQLKQSLRDLGYQRQVSAVRAV